MGKKIIPFIVVSILSFFSVYALIHPGLPPTHDGEYHVIRFYEFDKVLREGNFYPRWAPDLNNGYGVPLFNFVYPLPNYFASLFHAIGLSFIDAFKANMFLATLLSGVFMYLWSKEFFGEKGGVVSSVLYIFSPYHLLDIYIRGSVGEVWALSFFPAFLWSISKVIRDKKKIFIPISSIFLSLIIFSHNILALMFFPFAIVYSIALILSSKYKRKSSIMVFIVFFLGFVVSSIFWAPAFFEKSYTVGLEIYNVKEHFPDLYQLLIPSWGSGFSSSDLGNQMSFQIGVLNLIVVFITIVLVPLAIKRKQSVHVIFLLLFFFTFFLMLKQSSVIWDVVPLLNFFQFPWRLLSLEILIVAFLGGGIVVLLRFNKWIQNIYFLFIIVVAIGLTNTYIKPAYYHYRDDNHYTTRSNFIDGTNSPGNLFNTIWFDSTVKKARNKIEVDKDVQIKGLSIATQEYQFNISSQKESRIVVNIAYFPGWSVFLDGKAQKIEPDKKGRISFMIPHGDHQVLVSLINTKIQIISLVISLFSLMIILTMIFKYAYATIKR